MRGKYHYLPLNTKGLFMDMTRINTALEAYKATLSEADYGRLEFFKGIWEIQERLAARSAEAGAGSFSMPPGAEALEWYWQEMPFFLQAPVSIDTDVFVAALEEISHYIVLNAGLEQTTAECLDSFDWESLVDATELSLAGSNPLAYSQDFCDAASAGSGAVLKPELSIIVLGYALRVLLEAPARMIMGSLAAALKKENASHDKPLRCPACGSQATAAFVGLTPSSQGNAKLLYCSICGTQWEFERIRCARCGSRNQGRLHYYHLETDDAHRLHICDDCGGYTRTVFQENLDIPFVFEVEDVVMTPLDMIANA